MKESIDMARTWRIERYPDQTHYAKGEAAPVVSPDGTTLPAVSVMHGNILLNEGAAALINLLTGAAETAFSEANSYLGVGDDNTAAADTQTGLQASSNKAYVAMESSYPSVTDQTVTWRAVFDGSTANFDWNEFTVASGSSDAADNLNRLVSDQGTKASPQIWTLNLEIEFS